MRQRFPHGTFLRNIFWSVRQGFPYKLLFIVTFACISRCITCNNWKMAAHDELTLSEIERIFSSIPFRITWLAITGGEPFMRDDLADIVELARMKMPSLQMVSLVSNGLLTQKIVGDLEKILKLDIPFLFIRFSLDGPPEVHNRIRNMPDAYVRTMETYKAVEELTRGRKEVNLGFELTISSANISSIGDFLPELLLRHRVNITLAHKGFLYHNSDADDDLFTVSRDRIGKILALQRKKLNPLGASDMIQREYLKALPRYIEDPASIERLCAGLRSSFGIDPCGRVIPCLMWDRPLGNLRDVEYDIQRLWYSPEKSTILKEIAEKKCPRCWTPCEAYQKILSDIMGDSWGKPGSPSLS
jgi:Fe-coproporphyrin III synthase